MHMYRDKGQCAKMLLKEKENRIQQAISLEQFTDVEEEADLYSLKYKKYKNIRA